MRQIHRFVVDEQDAQVESADVKELAKGMEVMVRVDEDEVG